MNTEHFEIIKSGATAWNKWRAENPSIIPYLTNAYLTNADLTNADLTNADLTNAYLTNAHLTNADLTNADLTNADLYGCVNFPEWRQCPEVGSFVGWKKLHNGTIAQLIIPDGTPRINGIGSRKCRAREVRVIDGDGYDARTGKVHYKHGELIRCDKWNPDPRLVCAGGIHFYITRREAEEH